MAFKKIKIVLDSVNDLSPEMIARWDMRVIPCFVNYGGKSYKDDGVELVRDEFYAALPDLNTRITTAAPSSGMAEEVLREALEDADHVISISVASKLSATMNAVRLAAEAVDPERITLVDSESVSIGIGLQALIAAEVAEQTGDVAAVLDAIERARHHEKVYAAIATMEYLRRSGRVNTVVASVGTLLQIKPIVEVIDGEVLPEARVRTFKRALEKLVQLVEVHAPFEKLAVLHINNVEDVMRVKEQLAPHVDEEQLFVGQIGPTLGTHVGPGTVGVAFVSQKWRQ